MHASEVLGGCEVVEEQQVECGGLDPANCFGVAEDGPDPGRLTEVGDRAGVALEDLACAEVDHPARGAVLADEAGQLFNGDVLTVGSWTRPGPPWSAM